MSSDAITPRTATLAERLIAQYFAANKDQLVVGGIRVDELAKAYGTPLFAYDAGILRATYQALAHALDGFAEIYFSIKANPNPNVAQVFVDQGAGIEIASIGEFEKAKRAGCKPSHMLFAGPAKGEHELRQTLSEDLGEVHLESFEEIEHVAGLARELKRTCPVAVRVNPMAAAQGGAMRMGGKAAAFGFDEEILPEVVAEIKRHNGLKLSGVHMFAGTQILDADVLLTQWVHGLKIASAVAEMAGHALETIDLGGGLGVPYFEGDRTLNLASIRIGVDALKAQKEADAGIRGAHVIVEPGRFLTASSGVYLMQVRVAKSSREERFVICDGGMHHHLAASGNLGQVIKRDFPIVAANKLTQATLGPATIAGPLCTPLDTVGRKTQMPQMKAGDLVAILQSGAYGLSASPTGFLSQAVAKEVLIDDGKHCQI